MELFAELTWVHWLALGLLMLAAEALGASGFLIGAAVAALAHAILVALFPDLGFVTQLVTYAVTATVATLTYFQIFRDAQKNDGTPALNNRADRLIGTRLTLDEAVDGTARLQIGDTFWRVRSEAPLTAGTEVEVISTEGMGLVIAERTADG